MEIIAFAVVLIVIMLMAYSFFVGLNLRNPASWLIGAFAFFCGIAFGLIIKTDLIKSVKLGAMFAFFILIGGATVRPYLERFGLPKLSKKGDCPSAFTKREEKTSRDK